MSNAHIKILIDYKKGDGRILRLAHFVVLPLKRHTTSWWIVDTRRGFGTSLRSGQHSRPYGRRNGRPATV